MKKALFIISSFIMIILVGCVDDQESSADKKQKVNKAEKSVQELEQTSKDNTTKDTNTWPSQSSFEVTHQDQTIHVIPLYEEVLSFTNEVLNSDSNVLKEAYSKHVLKAFQEKAAEKDAEIGSNCDNLFSHRTKITQLKENTLELLNSQTHINDLLKKSIVKSISELPGKDKTVFIMPLNPDQYFPIHNMGGIAGRALTEDVFVIQIYPSFDNDMFTYVVPHEYMHTVDREDGRKANSTVLDGVLIEGKADVFASHIYPDIQAPWLEPLNAEERKELLKVFQKKIGSRDYDFYTQLREGNASKGIPVWSNYKLGYWISRSYLNNHPDVTFRELTNLSGEDILAGSDYRDLIAKRNKITTSD